VSCMRRRRIPGAHFNDFCHAATALITAVGGRIGVGRRVSNNGITNESGELLAGEFYTRDLAKIPSYIALPEQHRLATWAGCDCPI
jgi:hypothetical protein